MNIKQKKDGHNIRVLTYNLLNHTYCNSKFFHFVKEEYLDNDKREEKVASLLGSWTKVNFIICFQEMDSKWEEFIRNILQQKNYILISSLYADGIMGVGIAYPVVHYEVMGVDKFVPSKTICNIREKIKNNIIEHIVQSRLGQGSKSDKFDLFLIKKEKEISNDMLEDPIVNEYLQHEGNIDHNIPRKFIKELIESIKTDNTLLSVYFAPKSYDNNRQPIVSSNKRFLISTYHMPCRFTSKYYMMLHIYSLKNRLNYIQKMYEAQENIPISVILTGDFNSTPDTPEYSLLTFQEQNFEEKKEKHYHTLFDIFKIINTDFSDQTLLRSVFKEVNGAEPDYTNVCVQRDKTFVGCLDYILVSENVGIRSCQAGLTVKNPEQIQYPNYICPSDHIALSASLIV